MISNPYIIITPAKNEEKFIEKTIKSVINQTIKPIRWVIVDDGSTDATAEIVKKYLKDYPFIKLIRRETNNERHFGNKVYAIRRGFEEIKDIEYQYYCNLDADVSFESDYFEFLLKKFAENPKLGICGGKIYDLVDGRFVPQKYENHSVAGPIQFFRKECYESFGGYPVSKLGFIDGFAEISARMRGWITITYEDLKVYHYRPVGTFRGSLIKRCFDGGKIEFYFGYSYIYHLLRNLPRLFGKPYVIGYFATLLGYIIPKLIGKKRYVENDFVKYLREEQIDRIKLYINKKIKI